METIHKVACSLPPPPTITPPKTEPSLLNAQTQLHLHPGTMYLGRRLSTASKMPGFHAQWQLSALGAFKILAGDWAMQQADQVPLLAVVTGVLHSDVTKAVSHLTEHRLSLLSFHSLQAKTLPFRYGKVKKKVSTTEKHIEGKSDLKIAVAITSDHWKEADKNEAVSWSVLEVTHIYYNEYHQFLPFLLGRAVAPCKQLPFTHNSTKKLFWSPVHAQV